MAPSTETTAGAVNRRSGSRAAQCGGFERQPRHEVASAKNNAAARDVCRALSLGLSRAAAFEDRTGTAYFFPAATGVGVVFWKL